MKRGLTKDNLNYIKKNYLKHEEKSECLCIFFNKNEKILNKSSIDHDINDIEIISKCLNDYYSKQISKLKWIDERFKEVNCLDLKLFWSTYDNESKDFHVKNNQDNIKIIEEWNK